MKKRILLLVVFAGLTAFAQKRMIKSFSAENIETINFNFNQVSNIAVSTSDTQKITIEAIVEGENSEHIVLTNRKYMNALFISSDFQPAYRDANDKLSAHKVISVELLVTLPKHLRIYIKSDIGDIQAMGSYKKLTLELSEGRCILEQFNGNALINTQNGAIDIQTNFAQIETNSAHGKVLQEEIETGENKIQLNSVNGDITITKYEKS